jgi:flagellar motility protein MotE (MotC chaperone)
MIKLKLNKKKLIPLVLFFIVIFAISSYVMISLKKAIEKKMGVYYASKVLEMEEKYRKKESSEKEAVDQEKTKDAVRAIKGFSPEEIRKYQQELKQRIALYEKKLALFPKKEREIAAFKADVENRKKEMAVMRKKLDGALLLISKERIDLDRDLIVFDEGERKNLKRLADIYSSMDALKAAKVLSKLKKDTSAKVLTGMQSKKSAKIITEFDPTFAAVICEKIKRLQIVNKDEDETLKERNIKKLAAIYQRLETKKAVSIIKKLKYETAVSILSKMNGKNLAKILEFVETDEASKLTEAIRKIIEKEFQKTKDREKGA